MAHLWSGRFDTEPDPSVFEFGVSLAFDRRLVEEDIDGSLAWAAALVRAGAISAADGSAIHDGLVTLRDEIRLDPGMLSGPDEDIHAFVDPGKRLHTGRSRNEQVSLDLRLYLKRHVPQLQLRLRRVVAALAAQAASAGQGVMPSYTHMRRAQPILVAHYFVA